MTIGWKIDKTLFDEKFIEFYDLNDSLNENFTSSKLLTVNTSSLA